MAGATDASEPGPEPPALSGCAAHVLALRSIAALPHPTSGQHAIELLDTARVLAIKGIVRGYDDDPS